MKKARKGVYEKIGNKKCPFCGEEFAIYHFEDEYNPKSHGIMSAEMLETLTKAIAEAKAEAEAKPTVVEEEVKEEEAVEEAEEVEEEEETAVEEKGEGVAEEE